jgi:hypothetical protein
VCRCRCSVEADVRFSGSELRSPAPCNQLVSDRRSPLHSTQDKKALAASQCANWLSFWFLGLFSYLLSILLHHRPQIGLARTDPTHDGI